jgi:hypothetical protein
MNIRGLGILVAVIALLIFANLAQASGDAAAAFRASAIADPRELDVILAARQGEVVVASLLEYAALVVVAVGVIGAIIGPRLVAPRSPTRRF